MDRKLDITKIVLQELVLRLRAEEKFMKNMNEAGPKTTRNGVRLYICQRKLRASG